MARVSKERLAAVTELVDNALDGNKRAQGAIKEEIENSYLQEDMTTSDFPSALKAVTEIAFLGQYQQLEPVYTQYTREYDVNNLRPQSFYSLFPDLSNLPAANGGAPTITALPGGLPRIPELTEFPTFSFSASETSWGVAKYGARVNFSFEMLLNDEWGVLESLPTELAQLARNQEDLTAIEALVSPTGPNTNFFSNTNGNLMTTANGFANGGLTTNPVLSVDAVVDAISVIRQKKYNGNPVTVPSFILMVPPALAVAAERLIQVTAYKLTNAQNETYFINNPIADIQLVVNPWIPIVNTSSDAKTAWMLLPAQSAGVRPAVVFSKIRGRETPELRIHSATGNYLGGGEVPGREGSFLNDDIEFRVRHFVGAAGIAFETAVYSTGLAA